MTEQQLPTPPTTSPVPMLITMGVFILGGGAVLAILSPVLMRQMTPGTPRLATDAQLTMNASALVGASHKKKKKAKKYTPTSAYIEKGADSNVTKLDMTKKSTPSSAESEIVNDPDEGIQSVITRRQNDLIMCYAEGLQDDGDLRGRVDFKFGIAADGHVAMVKVVRSGLKHKPTEDCFVNKSKKWAFPKRSGKAITKFDTHFNFVAD